MGRATRGVKGITLQKSETVVGMVVADAERTLLSICEYGYGKRTPFGVIESDSENADSTPDEVAEAVAEAEAETEIEEETSTGGNMRYRRQKRGGKGLRDIKTTKRNGQVVDVLSVMESDEVLMVTSRGKIQRVRAADISTVGRNTQGVRIIRLDENDTLVSCAVIPAEAFADALAEESAGDAAPDAGKPDALADAAPAETPVAETTPETDADAGTDAKDE